MNFLNKLECLSLAKILKVIGTEVLAKKARLFALANNFQPSLILSDGRCARKVSLAVLSKRPSLFFPERQRQKKKAGNIKGGSITVLLTSCLTGLD
jgi:hypothetical protein